MKSAPFVAAIMATIALAGCLSNSDGDAPVMAEIVDPDSFFDGSWYDSSKFDPSMLSQPIYEPLPVEEVWTTVSDGAKLHSAVYRPDTTEATPAFINFSPYHGDTAEARGDGFGQYLIDHFVPRGYTVILSSIRGTGHSEGCFEVASDREAMDLSEVVDFFAEQPWSNGNIAAGGKSYDSTTQNGAIAKFPTDNLKAIFHVSGITDMYEYTYHNGLPARADAAAFTTYYSAGQGTDEYGLIATSSGFGAGSDATNESPESLQRLSGDISCTENAENVAFPVASTGEGSKTAYWQERDWASVVADTTWEGSIFFYHGFHDWNVQPSHILPWLDNLPAAIDTKVWLHQDRENSGHLYPMRADWNLTMLRWLDHELKGIDTGFWDEPRAELQGSDRQWRSAESWPSSAELAVLPLGESVDLQDVPPSDAYLLLQNDGDENIRYSGAPSITVTATPGSPDPVFSAQLFDRNENGAVQWRNEATMRLLYVDGLESPVPVTPGTAMTFTVDFYAQDDVLEPGHSWVLVLQELPANTVTTPAALEGLMVDASSVLVNLPFVSASDSLLEHQPRPTDCFAC